MIRVKKKQQIEYAFYICQKVLLFFSRSMKNIIDKTINLKNEGIRILKEEKHITIIHDDISTDGTTGSHAFGDDVRPQVILRDLLWQFSMKKESSTFRGW